jgi:hypothetical protein
MIFQFDFMPLDRHPDDGFGAVGNAFEEAAGLLSKPDGAPRDDGLHAHLPVNYLYRHAIELNLKSVIVIVHRRLRLTDATGHYNPIPQIPTAKARRPIHNVHGLVLLFHEVKRLFTEHSALIAKVARTDWSSALCELEAWISTIDAADPGSAVFRYPQAQHPESDARKSSFQPVAPEEVARAFESGTRQQVMLMIDGDDSVTEAFRLNRDPLPEVRGALAAATDVLSTFQYGVVAEFVLGLEPPRAE